MNGWRPFEELDKEQHRMVFAHDGRTAFVAFWVEPGNLETSGWHDSGLNPVHGFEWIPVPETATPLQMPVSFG